MCGDTFSVALAEVNIHFYSHYIQAHRYEDATYEYSQHPRTFLLFKTFPYIFLPMSNHILYGRRRGRHRPVGLPANHYLTMLLLLPPDSPPRDLSTNTIRLRLDGRSTVIRLPIKGHQVHK